MKTWGCVLLCLGLFGLATVSGELPESQRPIKARVGFGLSLAGLLMATEGIKREVRRELRSGKERDSGTNMRIGGCVLLCGALFLFATEQFEQTRKQETVKLLLAVGLSLAGLLMITEGFKREVTGELRSGKDRDSGTDLKT